MLNGLVVVPTYNESGNIEQILSKILLDSILDILVVDDRSPDGTADIVKNHSKYNDRIFLIEHGCKDGLGKAYIDGFKKALEWGYDFVIQMDADLSHDSQVLNIFTQMIQNYDAVFGSRYITGGGIVNWGFKRLFLSVCANLYAKYMIGVPLSDLTGGYNAYTSAVLKSIDFDCIHARGYMFQIEMKSVVFFANFSTKEVPIVFTDRILGETKMRGNIIFEAFLGCPLLRIRKLFNKLPIIKKK